MGACLVKKAFTEHTVPSFDTLLTKQWGFIIVCLCLFSHFLNSLSKQSRFPEFIWHRHLRVFLPNLSLSSSQLLGSGKISLLYFIHSPNAKTHNQYDTSIFTGIAKVKFQPTVSQLDCITWAPLLSSPSPLKRVTYLLRSSGAGPNGHLTPPAYFRSK